MHGEIARAIAQQVEAELTPREEARLARAPEVDPEVFEAYLRGMHLLHEGGPQNVQEGLQYLHSAVERNPADALAYAGLAYGYVTVGHGPNGTPDSFARAGEAAERAIALDPELAEAHSALAQVEFYLDWDWAGAEQEFRRAIELNPSLASNRYHLAWLLATLGRAEEAIAEHRLAKELDPLTPVHTAWLGGLYLFLGRTEEALPHLHEINELVPNNFWGHVLVGETYMAMGMPDSAIAVQSRIAATQPRAEWLLARNLAAAGRSDEARTIAARLEADPNPWRAFGLGAIYATLGDNDRAWQWLSWEPQHSWIVAVRYAYWFEGLRDDPRLPEFLARFGLAPIGPWGHRMVVPSLVLYEWLRGPRLAVELEVQEAVPRSSDAIPFGADEARVAAELHRSVRRARGREIDLAVAACAITWQGLLWTLNPDDFGDIPGPRLYA
jgi:adenylate cyclase